MAPTTTATMPLLTRFATRARELHAAGPDWVRRLRRDGLARFERLGLPSTREEAWRTTNVSALATMELQPPADADARGLDERLPALARLGLGGPRLVFLDGRLVRELSTPRSENGLWVGSLADGLRAAPERLRPQLTRRDPATAQAFEALNVAFLDDGAVVLAEDGVDAGAPVELVFVSGGGSPATACHPRCLISAGRGARLRVIETHVGLGDGLYLTNPVTDLLAEDDAALEHYRVQLDGPAAIHISNVHGRQTRDSRCALYNFDLGARLARHDVVSVLDGEGADCRLNGLYLTRHEQHVDNHTVLDHARPHGSSRELYKGVLDGASRAVFNGRIVVRQDAQRTDAKQSNPTLLLSPRALASTRPQLEIYADDVKCTHGATVGRLDEDAVFYLRSRGIGEGDARHLMLAAFAGEVLQQIGIDELRAGLEREVAARLPRGGNGDAE